MSEPTERERLTDEELADELTWMLGDALLTPEYRDVVGRAARRLRASADAPTEEQSNP